MGRYSGSEGIERMDAALDLSHAIAIRQRWQEQYYVGAIELWELQQAGHFREVAWPESKEA